MNEYPVEIHYVFYWKNKPLDCSNQAFLLKMIEDGLVRVGVLTNDSPTFVKKISMTVEKGKDNYVEIQITKAT